ncbi:MULTISPECIES: hypothetical protein [Roseomonadaceae]|uniref:Uncharacterized protein n=1 Tax=Falsiroseomonas oleicola TaxID=2801474 RepID=A0ABS6H7V2_9PROT|nr:hypothetical protein [Roseomonas oleicola]MBU8544461.1 hypothetical protein [Roseomonas oleicola]
MAWPFRAFRLPPAISTDVKEGGAAGVVQGWNVNFPIRERQAAVDADRLGVRVPRGKVRRRARTVSASTKSASASPRKLCGHPCSAKHQP